VALHQDAQGVEDARRQVHRLAVGLTAQQALSRVEHKPCKGKKRGYAARIAPF